MKTFLCCGVSTSAAPLEIVLILRRGIPVVAKLDFYSVAFARTYIYERGGHKV